MPKLNGTYCFYEHTPQGIKRSDVVRYTFEDGVEVYFTTVLDRHQKKTFIRRIWDQSFLDKLIEV